jgi:hypothetical protein
MALQDNWNYNPAGFNIQTLDDDAYTELRSSGKEQFTETDGTANRVFEVNWDVRQDFIDDCLGYSSLASDNITINRVIPDEHPDYPLFYALDATVEGKGVLGQGDSPNGNIDWTHAVITVNYRPRRYLVADDDSVEGNEQNRYTSRNSDFSGEFLTGQQSMKFVTAPNSTLTVSPGRITGTQELTYTWHDVPSIGGSPFIVPNQDARDACIGCINSQNFDVNGYNLPIGTVLFLGQKTDFKTPRLGGGIVEGNPNGAYRWDIIMKFLYRNNGTWSGTTEGNPDFYIGHNFIWRVDKGAYDLITTDGTTGGMRLYPNTADLNSLWTIGAA